MGMGGNWNPSGGTPTSRAMPWAAALLRRSNWEQGGEGSGSLTGSTVARQVQGVQLGLANTSTELWPPKPKELLTQTLMGWRRAVSGM